MLYSGRHTCVGVSRRFGGGGGGGGVTSSTTKESPWRPCSWTEKWPVRGL